MKKSTNHSNACHFTFLKRDEKPKEMPSYSIFFVIVLVASILLALLDTFVVKVR